MCVVCCTPRIASGAKTANGLGIDVLPTLLATADEIIQ